MLLTEHQLWSILTVFTVTIQTVRDISLVIWILYFFEFSRNSLVFRCRVNYWHLLALMSGKYWVHDIASTSCVCLFASLHCTIWVSERVKWENCNVTVNGKQQVHISAHFNMYTCIYFVFASCYNGKMLINKSHYYSYFFYTLFSLFGILGNVGNTFFYFKWLLFMI